ncbi:RHS repeat-associated core domain-containing protein [Hafnia alvei]|uniref:RHS repeat domain-containing protein n=1 Tax=Hafnia alvei TaxID=569 RepID=UPI0028BE67C5|nr:RHS repeat-associated core domain-containing protein [Hafnia alvei]WNN53255.1 RHS repeat-associated core domain-containing protein [Hafnia alvei]
MVNAHNITWKYDVNGRLVETLVDKGGYRPLQWRYRWDARSQLTGLETPEGERWAYKYDPFGRRISKRCTNRNKAGMDFHWNGDQLAEEIPVGTDGKPEDENAIRWIYEPGNFTPLARYEKGQLHYAVTDTVGRIQELLTEEGTIVWKGKQQLWGKEEGRNQEDAPSCRLRFPGQYEDDESGLYYNRYRYYDGDTGQYVSPDPIGLAGGVNPYGYVANPLKYIDPKGLCKTDGGNKNPHGTYRPDRPLPRDKNGNPIPDVDAPHTQLGTKSGRKGAYTQAREWGRDENGNLIPKRGIDFTDHGRPNEHPNPHQHDYIPNPTGGTPQHGPAKPLEIP